MRAAYSPSHYTMQDVPARFMRWLDYVNPRPATAFFARQPPPSVTDRLAVPGTAYKSTPVYVSCHVGAKGCFKQPFGTYTKVKDIQVGDDSAADPRRVATKRTKAVQGPVPSVRPFSFGSPAWGPA